MFKRLALIIVILLLLPTLGYAQDELPGISAMARYFPANTVVFGALRTDENFVDQIVAYTQSTLDMAAMAGAPVTSVEDELNKALATVDTDFETVMAWLGDAAAFGVTADAMQPGSDMTDDVYFVVEIDDRAEAESFLKGIMPQGTVESTEGDYTLYTIAAPQIGTTFAIGDDLLLIYPSTIALPLLTREARLDSNADFLRAMGALANAPYNVVAYVDPRPFGEQIPVDGTGNMTLSTAPLALGWSNIDSTTFLDIAQLSADGAAPASVQAVDSNFAQHLPGNASGVIHATNLSGLVNNAIELADQMNASSGGTAPLPSKQIEQALAMFGIALDEDLLSWTTGDYALFYRTDLVDTLASAITNNVPDLSGLDKKFDFGLVIEATDSDKAKALAEKIGALVTMMSANAEGFETSLETIGGESVTVFSLSAPLDARTTLDVDLLLGATNDVFFFATRSAAERIISGDGMLSSNPSYVAAQDTLVPNPSFVFYADGEGVLGASALGAIVPLALLGPSIGNIFDNIVAELESGSVQPRPTATPTPVPPLSLVDPAEIVERFRASIDSIRSATISATVTEDGIYLTRLVFTSAE
jgi:hypothetical protein